MLGVRLATLGPHGWRTSDSSRGAGIHAANKTIAHPECEACECQSICHGGCPKHRHDAHRNFGDLDYFCAAYKMIFAKAVGPLRKEVRKLAAR